MGLAINYEMAECFVNKIRKSRGNTAVVLLGQDEDFEVAMFLHGSQIASWCPHYNSFYVTLAGHNTITTKSRLNALLERMYMNKIFTQHASYYQKKGKLYFSIDTYVEYVVSDYHSFQWVIYPPVGAKHLGINVARNVPEKSEPVQLTFEQYMEVLL